jgi:formylglycine-generating enzyme required for sulfatase activity
MAIAHMQDPLPRLPPAHRAWQQFLDRALAKSLNDRFQSAEEMLRALDEVERRLLAQGPIETVRAAVAPRMVRGPLLVLFGIVLALAAIVVVGGIGPFAPGTERDELANVEPPPDSAVAAVPVADMDQWLKDAYAALDAGRLVEAGGNDAATPVLQLLALQPSNAEARQALARIFDALAKSSERAFARDAGDQAAAAQSRALELRQRGGEAGDAAWSTFRQRYTNALLAALDRAAARGDTSAPSTLEPAIASLRGDTAVAAALARLAGAHGAGEALRDAGGPAMVVVPRTVGASSVARDFAIAVDEVTREQYAEFARATRRSAGRCRDTGALAMLRKRDWRAPGFDQAGSEPVVCVTLDDASAYARWLSQRTGQRYRLPTRAEWRHVAASVGSAAPCRLGNVLDTSTAGNIDVVDRHDCDDGRQRTASVGRYAASTLGVHDLVGNVSEWTADCAPAGCSEHVIAGSSWRDGPKTDLLPQRERDASLGATWIGFRVVRELDAAAPGKVAQAAGG